MYLPSLTHLDNINGYDEDNNSVYGAEFTEVKSLSPFYERVIHYNDQKPWKNQNMDKTYMNYYKMRNEPEVMTYKQLILNPIPRDNHELIENFGENSQNFYAKLLSFLFLLFVVYYLVVN